MQCRKSIKVIDSCKDCPCYSHLYWGDPREQWACNNIIVKRVYKRILEYYPETHTEMFEKDTSLDNNVSPAIAFSENDKKEIEEDGFPYWCPLERSK